MLPFPKVANLLDIIYLCIFPVKEKRKGKTERVEVERVGEGGEKVEVEFYLLLFDIFYDYFNLDVSSQHPKSLIAMGATDTNKIASHAHTISTSFFTSHIFS